MSKLKFILCFVPVVFMVFLPGCGLLLGGKAGGTFHRFCDGPCSKRRWRKGWSKGW